jgi:hypothetical protein
MSWSALDWASKQKAGNGTNKLVLLSLANFADDNNTCFPSFKTLVNITELSRSTIIRSLKDLEYRNHITISERFVDINEGKRQTSNLYTLLVGFHNDSPQYQYDTPPSITEKLHITNHNKPNIYDDDFLTMWKHYPRKDGSKKKAFETYYKLCCSNQNVITKKDLLNFVIKYSKVKKNENVKYIPHFVTWLNQRRWETIETGQEKVNLNSLVG